MGDPVTIAAVVTAATAVVGAGVSAKQAHDERKSAKRQQEAQAEAIEEQKQEALEERKTQIDKQRAQLQARGDSTKSSTGTKGVRAIISDTTLG